MVFRMVMVTMLQYMSQKEIVTLKQLLLQQLSLVQFHPMDAILNLGKAMVPVMMKTTMKPASLMVGTAVGPMSIQLIALNVFVLNEETVQ